MKRVGDMEGNDGEGIEKKKGRDITLAKGFSGELFYSGVLPFQPCNRISLLFYDLSFFSRLSPNNSFSFGISQSCIKSVTQSSGSVYSYFSIMLLLYNSIVFDAYVIQKERKKYPQKMER